MVSVTDFYDAVTSNCAYQKGTLTRGIYYDAGSDGKRLSAVAGGAVMQCLSTCPVVSLVSLESGEGVVMTLNLQRYLHSLLTLLLGGNKQSLPRVTMMDLELQEQSEDLIRVNKILA
jgi:hypothetical protein